MKTWTLPPFTSRQGVFDHRMKTWQKWQDSQLLLQKKREAEAKLQLNNKPDKLQQAKDEIKEVSQGYRNAYFQVKVKKNVADLVYIYIYIYI